MKKLAIAGCKHTTLDLIKGLQRAGFRIDHVITIDQEKAKSQKVSGYLDIRPFLESEQTPYYTARKYSLKSTEDKTEIKALNIDILLCMGWQRLIPDWLLGQLSVGAFGMHGSNKPLPHGRGRSPMNWSIIQDKSMFFTHLFRYKPGVDDGDVIGYQLFDITPFDTALTLHHKNLLAMIKLCTQHLPNLLNGIVKAEPQPDVEPSYYPKRTAEDGLLHWELATKDLYNLIRAVTTPFPGAFTYFGSGEKVKKIIIWKAIPFDTHIRWDGMDPGVICEIFFDGTFIVKTGDTSILIQDYEGIHIKDLSIGSRLHNNGIERKEWPHLPH